MISFFVILYVGTFVSTLKIILVRIQLWLWHVLFVMNWSTAIRCNLNSATYIPYFCETVQKIILRHSCNLFKLRISGNARSLRMFPLALYVAHPSSTAPTAVGIFSLWRLGRIYFMLDYVGLFEHMLYTAASLYFCKMRIIILLVCRKMEDQWTIFKN